MSDDTLNNPQERPFPEHAAELLAMPSVLSVVALSTDTPHGWCPFATRQSTPNFWTGNMGRKAVVDHVTDAGWASVVSWFKNPASQRSAHFQVRKDGTIDQFVSVEDSAWANGASWVNGHWVDPQGHTISPTWAGMTPPINPNRTTISVEHEGVPADAWTAAQKAADTRLDQWLMGLFPSLRPFVAHQNLIGHYQISPVSKPNCPGPRVDLAERAAAANAVLPDPLRSRTIAGPPGTPPRFCSVQVDNFYAARGGLKYNGYPLTDEYRTAGANGQACTVLVCERVVIKRSDGIGVEQALLREAIAQEWL